jgi:hypothetical protein
VAAVNCPVCGQPLTSGFVRVRPESWRDLVSLLETPLRPMFIGATGRKTQITPATSPRAASMCVHCGTVVVWS